MAEHHSTGWPSQGASQALFIREPSGEYREATPKEVVACASRLVGKLFGRGSALSRPADAVPFLTMKLVAKDHEVFCALFLDNRYRVLAFEELFRGTINTTAVYPREVVKRALAHNAAAVIFSHNHPSGPPDPSDADRRLTETLKAALALIDVQVLDHFVIGDGSYSFAAHGLL